MLTTWSVQNAKAKFSELLDTCITSEPQIVTKRGQQVAVLVSIDEWQRLQHEAKPSLKSLLLTDTARVDELPVPTRTSAIKGNKPMQKRRDIPTFMD